MDPVASAVLLGGAGLVAGIALAVANWRLGGEAGAPPVARLAVFAGGAAGLSVWAALAGQGPSHAWLTALLGWQLFLVAAVDAEHFWLPDRLTLPLLVSGLGGAVLLDPGVPWRGIVGAAAGFGLLWLVALAYRRARGRDGLGGGDPFLLAAGGAWVGWQGLPSVLLWSAASGLSGVLALRLTGRSVAADTRLPFGVFLAVGIWMTWMFGPLTGFSR